MSTRLFVGNLDPQISEKQLAEFFSDAGEVVAVSIPRDRETKTPRGFGFVEFKTDEQAREAQESLDEKPLQGRRLRLRPAHDDRAGGGRGRSRRRQRAGRPDSEFEQDEDLGPRGARADENEDEDYSGRDRGRPHRGGRHGSDRKRGRGTRRVIE